jgi:hypothetical protein
VKFLDGKNQLQELDILKAAVVFVKMRRLPFERHS